MVPQCFKLALTEGKELIHWNRHKNRGRGKEKEGRARER